MRFVRVHRALGLYSPFKAVPFAGVEVPAVVAVRYRVKGNAILCLAETRVYPSRRRFLRHFNLATRAMLHVWYTDRERRDFVTDLIELVITRCGLINDALLIQRT